jgi:serine/threonine-protein kinase
LAVVATTHSLTDRLLGDRYRLGAVLGRGGMAEVYDGFDERLHRPVAVKVLLPEMAARADVRRRFEDEARAAARLVHPNVVGVFDSGEDGPDGALPYLVMERLPGETMADRMRAASSAGTPLDVEWVLRVAGDVLLALGAAHAAALVHRDVKPGNVLIAADGCAKVADFGIAKSLEVAAAGDLTSTNQLLGTPAYVAPERIEGLPATVESDLYAVGVLLYEALAGVKPFTGSTAVAMAYSIRHDTPEPLASLRPDLPPSLVAAVERAMARAPEDRFSSAAALAAALGVAPGSDATVVAAPVDATTVLPAVGGNGEDLTVDARTTAPEVVAAAPPLAVRGRGLWRTMWRDDRRRLVALAVGLGLVALVLLVLAAAGIGGGGGADASPARKALAADLRDGADGLQAAKDGKAAGDASRGLDHLAGSVEDGGGASEATALLGRLVAWRDGGALTTATADRLAGLVRRVPGVDPAAYTAPTTTTAAPPPTEAPAPAPAGHPRGKKKHGD